MKTIPTFGFTDEPQFRTTMTRVEAANRLKAYRVNPGNERTPRYEIARADKGYLVRLRYSGSPTAYITTR